MDAHLIVKTVAQKAMTLKTVVVTILAVAILLIGPGVPPASAHAELRQSSPEAGETVGGEFHQIALQFIDLDTNLPQVARLYDPAGDLIPTDLAQDGQRLVIPIEPLEVPGVYRVEFEVNGADGDLTRESFTFRYEPDADPPQGITIAVGGSEGFDFVGYGLLLAGAAIAAFLVHRFMTALREHRAAQRV